MIPEAFIESDNDDVGGGTDLGDLHQIESRKNDLWNDKLCLWKLLETS